jgi:hypothetical protein
LFGKETIFFKLQMFCNNQLQQQHQQQQHQLFLCHSLLTPTVLFASIVAMSLTLTCNNLLEVKKKELLKKVIIEEELFYSC